MFMAFMLIGIVFLLMSFALSESGVVEYDSEGSYECGFSPILNYRLPYSVQFFKIAVMFLLFDVELLLMMPMVILLNESLYGGFIIFSLLMFILVLGFLYEWNSGMMEWV
uniref:NADH-ubiquinone oxidoreductase chain 3 n=1 Tax=Setaphyes kielensis TaxID=3298910 RepID=A0A1I9VTS9_9BILA|nr:NADH dehydrogenase subunit 3 [Pycnophyes kielensis]APA17402.1 NADH dehydrogenase subunit 3 [Pycnophyes kielensis]